MNLSYITINGADTFKAVLYSAGGVKCRHIYLEFETNVASPQMACLNIFVSHLIVLRNGCFDRIFHILSYMLTIWNYVWHIKF